MENKSHWELVIHSNGLAKELTAVCANCNEPLFCNPYPLNTYEGSKLTAARYGTILYTCYFTASCPKKHIRNIMDSVARSSIQGHLPRYCACCGAEMTEDDKFKIRKKEIKED